jgi:hypothetical protein
MTARAEPSVRRVSSHPKEGPINCNFIRHCVDPAFVMRDSAESIVPCIA